MPPLADEPAAVPQGEEGASGGGVPLSAWFDVSARSAVARRAGCSLLMQLVPTGREEGEEAALGAGSGFRLLLLARAQAREHHWWRMTAVEHTGELAIATLGARGATPPDEGGGVCGGRVFPRARAARDARHIERFGARGGRRVRLARGGSIRTSEIALRPGGPAQGLS